MVICQGEPACATFPNVLRGVTFIVCIFTTAFVGPTVLILPFLPILFLRHGWWRKYIDQLVGTWFIFVTRLLELCFNVKVNVTGELIEHEEPGLIIMNHRTGLDWLFFWNALFNVDWRLLTSLKIVLKGAIKKAPGAGWAMQLNSLLFLNRRMEEDKEPIEDMVEYWARNGSHYQVLMYPEGTIMCKDTLEKSRKWEEKLNLERFDYVLHPRVKGFVLMVQKMRQLGSIKFVYDVTLAYSDVIVESELEIFKGNTPKDIRYEVEKFRIEDLPESDEGLEEWLNGRWKVKEQCLKSFYSQAQEDRHLAQVFEPSHEIQKMRNICTAVWFTVLAASVCMTLCYSQTVLPYYFVSSAIFVFVECFYGGFDRLQVKLLCQDSKSKKK
ncbi:hypothetical protein QR680_006496 [Steinernema hermaphroditum]|uniref:Phospholipid/glycerol acyltransferase domain-containing protein n=1 Tax=Steinernema hermaphroditum TaxID=289476 RepID=A0AA39HY57_9BILA|nr:hypothetical protein QR680_006496 [Steinernema hermaphroditum]